MTSTAGDFSNLPLDKCKCIEDRISIARVERWKKIRAIGVVVPEQKPEIGVFGDCDYLRNWILSFEVETT
jgi:hypothetical protein